MATVTELLKAANEGDLEAQCNLGIYYSRQAPIQKSDKDAFIWLRLAADGGHNRAKYYLGDFYLYGKVVEQDFNMAHKLFTEAHMAGVDRAGLALICHKYMSMSNK